MSSKKRSKLWVFGDSFMADNANWIHEISRKSNTRVNHLGHGGASVQHLLMELHRFSHLIQADDRVIIGISHPARFFLKEKHYHSWINIDYYKEEFYKKIQIEAFKDFIVQLYDTKSDNLYKGAIVSHIIKVMVPKLGTKHIQYVFTVDDEVYTKEPTLRIDPLPVPSLYTAFRNFIETNYDVDLEDNNKINELMGGPNHWLDHTEFHQYFWDIYEEHFSILYQRPLV